MRCARRPAYVILAVTFCALAIWLAAGSALAEEVIQQPTWSVGDWWEIGPHRLTVSARSDDQYELIRTPAGKPREQGEAKPYRVYMTGDGWISRRIEPDGTVVKSGEDARYEWVRFPLSPGREWRFGVLSRSRTVGRSTRYEYECRADQWDELSVAGRHVRTLRIECQSGIWGSKSRWGHTVWYAPEAKRYIRLTPHYVGGPALECSAWSVRP
jgi:hypothetical protein